MAWGSQYVSIRLDRLRHTVSEKISKLWMDTKKRVSNVMYNHAHVQYCGERGSRTPDLFNAIETLYH